MEMENVSEDSYRTDKSGLIKTILKITTMWHSVKVGSRAHKDMGETSEKNYKSIKFPVCRFFYEFGMPKTRISRI